MTPRMSEPTFAYMYDKLQTMSDAQQMIVYCALCPKWKASGTAKEARDKAENHRAEEHPELVSKKRVVRKRRSFSSAMTAEREAQIEEERRQRMRALGIG